jgi:mannosyltransferase
MSSLNICADSIIYSLQNAGGISVYWSALLQALKEIPEICLKQISYGKSYKVDYSVSKNRFYQRRFPFLYRMKDETLSLDDGAIFHSSYYRIHRARKVLSIITLYDFIHESYYNDFKSSLFISQKKRAIQFSNGIICISDKVRNELHKRFPDISKEKSTVISPGYQKFDGENESTGISAEKYLLYLGGRASYKRFSLAVEVAKNCKGLPFVIAGGGELSSSERSLLSDFSDRVYVISYIKPSQMYLLYKNALCLILPSLMEGYGMSLIEATVAGIPVLCSGERIPSSQEVSPVCRNHFRCEVKEDYLDCIHAIMNFPPQSSTPQVIVKNKLDVMAQETCDFYERIKKQFRV